MPPEKGCLFSKNIEKHRKTSQNIEKHRKEIRQPNGAAQNTRRKPEPSQAEFLNRE